MNFKKWSRWACCLLFVILLLLVVRAVLSAAPEGKQLAPGGVTVLDDRWEYGADPKTGEGEYRWSIPEGDGAPLWLCIKTYLRTFEVTLDGTVVYSFAAHGEKNERSFHMVELPPGA